MALPYFRICVYCLFLKVTDPKIAHVFASSSIIRLLLNPPTLDTCDLVSSLNRGKRVLEAFVP